MNAGSAQFNCTFFLQHPARTNRRVTNRPGTAATQVLIASGLRMMLVGPPILSPTHPRSRKPPEMSSTTYSNLYDYPYSASDRVSSP